MVGLWHHKARPMKFYLCISNFRIKYQSKNDTKYLCNAIRKNFRYRVDYEVKTYCRLTLKWNYELGYVDILMLKFIREILKKLNYPSLSHPHYLFRKYILIQYNEKGSFQQIHKDILSLLPNNIIKLIQSTTSSLLYYTRALNNTMLLVLNKIVAIQVKLIQ